jgi:hexosaminidase
MSWRGEKGGIEAAKMGHDVVMTPVDFTYFNLYQSQNRDTEPRAFHGFLPLETAYNYEPVPATLSPDEARHVLGAQFQLWTEYISDPKLAEYMVYPRACALSELVWSPGGRKDFDGFMERLAVHLKRLKVLDVNYRMPEVK